MKIIAPKQNTAQSSAQSTAPKHTHSNKNSKGFTLIEMMVAVGLFSIVMLVAVAAILSIIGNNKKAQGINNVVNNLNFAIESMVRDMKTGYFYQCPLDETTPLIDNPVPTANACGPGVQGSVAFYSTLSGEPIPVRYKFVPSATDNGIYQPGYITKQTDGGPEVELTSKTDVDIQSMKLYVNNPAPGTGQPSIFLIITGKAEILDGQVTQFGLQTFISQRILNLE